MEDNKQQDNKDLRPLDISIPDEKLARYLKHLEDQANAHYNSDEVNLKARREEMLTYLFGRQLKGKKLKKYQSQFIDNVIYEGEKMLKSLAVSKLPDIVTKTTSTAPEAEITKKLLDKAVDTTIKNPKTKKDLGMMFRHMPAYLIAAMKYRWDANKGKYGECVFEVLNPDCVIPDHTALEADPDKMSFIIHKVSKTGKEWAMLFPKSKDKIKAYVVKEHFTDTNTDDMDDDVIMAQKITVSEVWFDWFDEAEDFDAEKNPKFSYLSGVAWRLGEEILGKMKNPNWDYEGHDVATIDGHVLNDQELEQVMMASMMGMQAAQPTIQKVFNNYFDFPRKPFIFMTYDQFMRGVMDETSRIEQVVKMQKSMDTAEQNADYAILNNRGKNVFSKQAGLTKRDIEKLDLENPNQDIVISGDIDKAHKFIQADLPRPEVFNHIENRRQRMLGKLGVHGATRGELTTQVATSNQIAREADFTQSDDVVDDTVVAVATEMAKAKLHMMKLRYTIEHWKKLVGGSAEFLEARLDNDIIDDGVEVEVYASTTDKLKAERQANQLAQLGMIDPLSYYEDIGLPDPEKRTKRLMMMQMAPDLYLKTEVEGQDIATIAATIAPPPVAPGGQPTPQMAGGQNPMQPSPQSAMPPANAQGSVRGMMGGMVNKLRGAVGL